MDDKNIFSLVKEIIDKNDPIGLLKQGSPPDEYDVEIKSIIDNASKCKTVKELQDKIYSIFRDSFGNETSGNKGLYLAIAKDIFEKIKS